MAKLVKYSDNWGDEFDIKGFSVFTEKAYNTWIKLLDHVVYGDEIYFGTNEGIAYRNKEDYLNRITVTDLDEHEVDTLLRLFPRCKSYMSSEDPLFPSLHHYGIFIDPAECIEATDEELQEWLAD